MTEDRHGLAVGALTLSEMRAILESWPADVTFVDADGLIRFYTERYRIFSRTPAIIGTDVVECHSPGSRGRVAELIAELHDGAREEATFLEQKDGRPVHIHYLSVRNGDTYLGLLEVCQWADSIGS